MSRAAIIGVGANQHAVAGSGYPAAVLALTPTAYWKLDETGTLTTAVDEMAAFPGTYAGSLTPNQTGGYTGSKAVASAANNSNFITFGTVAIIGGQANWSYVGWVKYTNSDASIYCERGAGANDICKIEMRSDHIGLLYRNDGGTLSYEGSNAGTISGSAAATTLTSGTWYNVAVTRSGTTICIYLNGVLKYSWTLNSSSSAFTQTIACHLFNDAAASAPFNGVLDDTALWRSTLNSTQIAALYAAA